MRTETIEDVSAWMDVTIRLNPDGSCGQGGTVLAITAEGFHLLCGTERYERFIPHTDVHHITIEVPYDADECLNYGPDCSGPVDDWWAGGNRSWPRCTFHGEERLRSYETSMERYADSDVAPDWFDPADAGERWEDD